MLLIYWNFVKIRDSIIITVFSLFQKWTWLPVLNLIMYFYRYKKRNDTYMPCVRTFFRIYFHLECSKSNVWSKPCIRTNFDWGSWNLIFFHILYICKRTIKKIINLLLIMLSTEPMIPFGTYTPPVAVLYEYCKKKWKKNQILDFNIDW